MKSVMLTLSSIFLTATVIGNAYYQKKQFYPSVVYITKSNPSMAVIYIQAFVLVILMGKLTRKVFFGQLRAAELEHLIERSWYAVTETCLAFTVFRDDFSPKFVALFTLLLFLKCFHWLADDRVDYMERSPVISVLFHIRVISLLLVLGSLDAHFVDLAYYSTLTKGASVQLVFGFEYAILLTVVVNIFIKYVLHTIDVHNDNPWENKAVYLLYTELVMGFIKVALYMTFMVIMIKIHTFPLFAIRPMYLTLRSFKKALNDVIMSRRAIRNLNTLYPDATPEELASADNVCIICREEMTSASKKLPCNHIFHTSCLRSWFQRQQTCPTCRMDVLRISTQQNQQQAQQANGHAGQHPQQQQQPPPNMQGFFPGGFPMWPPPFPGQQQQQPQPGAATGTPPSAPGTSGGATGAAPSSSGTSTFTQGTSQLNFGQPGLPLPFMFFPPFPFVPNVIPMPQPPPNFSGMSEEELRNLEGQERQNVESRIQCLRNIQTLLDAAVVQMQQYSTVVAQLPPQPAASNNTADTQGDGSHNETLSTVKEAAAAMAASPKKESGNASPCTAPEDDSSKTAAFMDLNVSEVEDTSSLDEKEQLRRRRLQRFNSRPQGDEST